MVNKLKEIECYECYDCYECGFFPLQLQWSNTKLQDSNFRFLCIFKPKTNDMKTKLTLSVHYRHWLFKTCSTIDWSKIVFGYILSQILHQTKSHHYFYTDWNSCQNEEKNITFHSHYSAAIRNFNVASIGYCCDYLMWLNWMYCISYTKCG